MLTRRGWTYAVLPYPGYGVDGSARVLGRVVLAPAGTEPSAVRGVAGWRRLLTLQRSRVPVSVALPAGPDVQEHVVRSDRGGMIDVVLPAPSTPGTATVAFRAGGRGPVHAPVHVADPDARVGIVCGIDGTALVTGLRHPLRAAWRTAARAFAQRRPVEGAADLLTAFLREEFPGVRWFLVGDDGEDDPAVCADFTREHPDAVVAVALRQVGPTASPRPRDAGEQQEEVAGVPVLRGRDGHELLRRYRALGRDGEPAVC
ncbi:phosphatase domain-containing protein [Kineococcus sp. SYSU DK004]|uniref:phosphatase domain-containing protein n=1 Tax=Kineococcus sp. SYSU DK004 TaxID=3383125 RepID=UPI003D7D7013